MNTIFSIILLCNLSWVCRPLYEPDDYVVPHTTMAKCVKYIDDIIVVWAGHHPEFPIVLGRCVEIENSS